MSDKTQKKLDLSDIDLRKLDLTRKYDDDFSQDSISWRDHLLLYTIVGLIGFFLVWASFADVEEVARGEGKVIPSSEVQIIQSLEGGIIDEYLVKEGDVVEENQVILRIRNVQAKSDFDATTKKYLGLLASTTRLYAQGEGKDPVFSEEMLTGVPESVSAERASYDANMRQYQGQLGVLNEQLTQKQSEVAELERKTSDIASVMGLVQEERNMVAPMVEKGASSKKELLQLDRQLAEQRTELNSLKLALPRSRAAVKESEQRINEHKSSFMAMTQKELSDKTIELNTIKQTIAAFQDKSERNEMRSPVKGTVKDIRIKTVGGVARGGEPIMEIVPLEDQLIIEANANPSDIAFIHPGQKANVRLTAFDSSVYGAVEGEVIDISADSITNDKGDSFYRVRVRTKETKLEKAGKEYPIIPGMQASVDIITGKKTVMNYLLKPFVKASQTAMRER